VADVIKQASRSVILILRNFFIVKIKIFLFFLSQELLEFEEFLWPMPIPSIL